MFVYSVKAGKLRLIAILTLTVTLVALLALLVPSYATTAVFASDGTAVYTGVKDNDDRIRFLKSFGWEVTEEPIETKTVTVPSEFDQIFTGYNDLQKLQGLDLSRYRRRSVTRYTYKVTNYPNYNGEVYATLLVYRGKVIGGDVCSAEADGFIHGFSSEVRLG